MVRSSGSPSEHYRPFIEREWLETYWQRGLPKQHPKMHYYLNTFPHHTGRGRPVGPEKRPAFNSWFDKVAYPRSEGFGSIKVISQ